MSIEEAAGAIEQASHLLITAGAGMGVDSGLPDFRGTEGFWNAYPPYRKLGLSFVEMANPETFLSDPPLAWGFYGHRLELYRRTAPHPGFAVLLRWARAKRSHFVFTSNVDGHFQRAGFDGGRVYEVHGSIHHLQCLRPCSDWIRPADSIHLAVDPETMRAASELPRCPDCGAVVRPNILMFGDFSYVPARQIEQRRLYQSWLAKIGAEPLVVLEMGAGTAVPTVRHQGEQLAQARNARLVRINLREPTTPPGEISIPMGALEGIQKIDAVLRL